MMKTFTLLLPCVGLPSLLLGQLDGTTTGFAKPMPMQPDRNKDSYVIYSLLLESGPVEWRNSSRSQWLIEDTTNAMPLDVPCRTSSESDTLMMSPHFAVKAPEDRQAEWNEVLADYDQHCHDVFQLDRDSFMTKLPVHLVNTDEKQRFMKDPIKPPAEFANGAGLHRFTEVFFNANHTLALVEEDKWCGNRCGQWTWMVLERRKDRWKVLPWVHTFTVS